MGFVIQSFLGVITLGSISILARSAKWPVARVTNTPTFRWEMK